MLENIVIRGASQHNLKNLDVTIPRNKLVVITGLSGSGNGRRRYGIRAAGGSIPQVLIIFGRNTYSLKLSEFAGLDAKMEQLMR